MPSLSAQTVIQSYSHRVIHSIHSIESVCAQHSMHSLIDRLCLCISTPITSMFCSDRSLSLADHYRRAGLTRDVICGHHSHQRHNESLSSPAFVSVVSAVSVWAPLWCGLCCVHSLQGSLQDSLFAVFILSFRRSVFTPFTHKQVFASQRLL